MCFSYAAMGMLGWEAAFVLVFPLILIDAFVCLSPWYLCRVFPLENTRIGVLIAVQAASAALSTALLTAAGYGAALALGTNPAWSEIPGEYLRAALSIAVSASVLYVLSTLVHYLLANAEIARERKRQALELRLSAREAELKALRAQIDPHFLFNSLNTINALIAADAAAARKTCIMLADFLRRSLAAGDAHDISLSDELELIRSYLAVEKIRLAERLEVEITVAPDTLNCRIPPLLLQPLVENAIKHGIARLLEGGGIRISAARKNDRLRLTVSNPCDEERSAPMPGMGLSIMRKRLETAYGKDASLVIEDGNTSYRVDVLLPCRS